MEEIEKNILNEMDELLSSCKELCKDERGVSVIKLKEEVLYEGCDYCLVKTYLDALGLPVYSIPTSEKKYVEYVVLEDYVAEVSEDFIQFIHVDNFPEHVESLVEFSVMSAELANELVKWVSECRS